MEALQFLDSLITRSWLTDDEDPRPGARRLEAPRYSPHKLIKVEFCNIDGNITCFVILWLAEEADQSDSLLFEGALTRSGRRRIASSDPVGDLPAP